MSTYMCFYAVSVDITCTEVVSIVGGNNLDVFDPHGQFLNLT